MHDFTRIRFVRNPRFLRSPRKSICINPYANSPCQLVTTFPVAHTRIHESRKSNKRWTLSIRIGMQMSSLSYRRWAWKLFSCRFSDTLWHPFCCSACYIDDYVTLLYGFFHFSIWFHINFHVHYILYIINKTVLPDSTYIDSKYFNAYLKTSQ